MLAIKTYGNRFYPNRKNLHVQIPRRYQFPDNCLVLTMLIKPRYVLLHDNGEIFKSIDQSRSRINSPVYRHGLNKYAIAHHNSLQILTGVDLANVIFTRRIDVHRLNAAILDFVKFIKKIRESGLTFQYVY